KVPSRCALSARASSPTLRISAPISTARISSATSTSSSVKPPPRRHSPAIEALQGEALHGIAAQPPGLVAAGGAQLQRERRQFAGAEAGQLRRTRLAIEPKFAPIALQAQRDCFAERARAQRIAAVLPDDGVPSAGIDESEVEAITGWVAHHPDAHVAAAEAGA